MNNKETQTMTTAAHVIFKLWPKAIATTRGAWTTFQFRTTQSNKVVQKLIKAGFIPNTKVSCWFTYGEETIVVTPNASTVISVIKTTEYEAEMKAKEAKNLDLKTKGYHQVGDLTWIRIADRDFKFTAEELKKMKAAMATGKAWEERGSIMSDGYRNPGKWEWATDKNKMFGAWDYEGPKALLDFLGVDRLYYYGNFHGMY